MTRHAPGITQARTIDSPIGPITLGGHDDVLTHLVMHEQRHVPPGLSEWRRDLHAFGDVVDQLKAYWEGELQHFDVALRVEGTDFQRRVWQGLLDIPYGETWSYAELANHIGAGRNAPRAVGLANGRNPIAIIVPCHRVIGANGRLVGYGGGLERKSFLLDLEGARYRGSGTGSGSLF